MATVGIYKITSPTGRVYIGQSRNIEKRKNNYKNHRCGKQRRLFASLEKYGFENHVFEVIEECDFSELNNRERFYQEKFNVLDQDVGLNCTMVSCDEKPRHFSEESIRRMSESNKRWLTKENREKIRLGMLGKVVPEERRLRISKKLKGRKKSDDAKANMKMAQKKAFKSEERIRTHRRAMSNRITKTTKIVLHLESGVYFYGMKDAARSLGFSIDMFAYRMKKCNSHINNTGCVIV